jgi:hypothetical protein
LAGNVALFTGTDSNGYLSLWVTNGNHIGAGVAGAPAGGLVPLNLSAIGSAAVFEDNRLWVTDETAAGTHMLTSVSGANFQNLSDAAGFAGSAATGASVSVSNPIAAYTITQGSGAVTITNNATHASQTFANISQRQFSDITDVFDLHSAQDVLVYELYQAAYARTPDNGGFRYWAGIADSQNTSAISLADSFLSSPEFSRKYGAKPNNTAYVTALYTNVLGHAPDQGGLSYWIAQANTGEAHDQFLVAFSTSPENAALIGSHISNGFWTT